jgi:hypothetical protein
VTTIIDQKTWLAYSLNVNRYDDTTAASIQQVAGAQGPQLGDGHWTEEQLWYVGCEGKH